MRGTAAALAAVALALGAMGCGGGNGAAAGETATAPVGDTLTVRHLEDERLLGTERLDCAGAGAEVCVRVAAVVPGLAPAPGEVCTQIYGGPQRIALSGTLDGAPVDVSVGRTDGCEIARYDRLAAALDG